jgi:hypothetical protein
MELEYWEISKNRVEDNGGLKGAVGLGYPVTWSSIWDANHNNPRIDQNSCKVVKAWCAGTNDKDDWIQVALPQI